MTSETRYVKGYGNIQLMRASYGIMEAAYKLAIDAKVDERGHIFTNFIVKYMVMESIPHLNDISELPNETIVDLINIALEYSGLSEKSKQLSDDVVLEERFFRAYVEWAKEFSETLSLNLNHLNAKLTSVGQTIDQAVENVANRFASLQETLQTVAKTINQHEQQIQKSVNQFVIALEQSLKEAREADSELHTPLINAGFWIPPSASFDLIRALKHMVNQGHDSPDEIREAIIEYYREDDCTYLREMVQDWNSNPYFADRMQIITDSLSAHVNGIYTLTIPALLPLVEGILIATVGKRETKMYIWAEGAINNKFMDTFQGMYKNAVITYITGNSFYGIVDGTYFTPDTYPTWLQMHGLEGKQVLQRHAILHGVQLEYASEENSLRAFFLLDVLAWLGREKWDENLRLLLQGT